MGTLQSEFCKERQWLSETGRLFFDRGWAFGTSGNYSVVVGREPLRLLVTASGKDKSALTDRDFIIINEAGDPLDPGDARPSAEAKLHATIAALTGVGAVLHTHSVWNTLLSDLFAPRGKLLIRGYEMLKGLAGISSHEDEAAIAIFENTQDIPALAADLGRRLDAKDVSLRHAFLIRAHGLYTWGKDLAEARRHVEILEFLFEVIGRRLSVAKDLGCEA